MIEFNVRSFYDGFVVLYTLELVSHILPRDTIRSDGVFVIIIHTYNNIYCDSIAILYNLLPGQRLSVIATIILHRIIGVTMRH